jgi:hypothetical protein
MRIRRQPAHTPGLVGHALDTDLIEKTLWTVSAWMNNAELNQFNRTDPHRSIKCTIRSAMLPTTLCVSGPAHAGKLPIGWDEVRRRISETET